MSAANRTIVLQGSLSRGHLEKLAAAVVKPGYALEMTSANKFQSHSTHAGGGRRIFAKEDPYRGGVIEGTDGNGVAYYAVGSVPDTVFAHEAIPGEKMNCVLGVGENVTKGDWAISLGNGRMGKAANAVIANTVADSATLTSWTTEVAFSNSSHTLPANSLKVGDIIRVRAVGRVPSSNGTDTVTIRLLLGAVVLLTTGALNITDADIFEIDFNIRVRTIGASGTFVGDGSYTFGPAATAVRVPVQLASTAVDTTAAQVLALKAAASASSAANQVILASYRVEEVNSGTPPAAPGGSESWGQFEEDMNATSAEKFCALTVK